MDLIYALLEDDRESLLNIYSDICRYDGNYSFTNGSKDSKLDSFSQISYSSDSGSLKKNNQRK